MLDLVVQIVDGFVWESTAPAAVAQMPDNNTPKTPLALLDDGVGVVFIKLNSSWIACAIVLRPQQEGKYLVASKS